MVKIGAGSDNWMLRTARSEYWGGHSLSLSLSLTGCGGCKADTRTEMWTPRTASELIKSWAHRNSLVVCDWFWQRGLWLVDDDTEVEVVRQRWGEIWAPSQEILSRVIMSAAWRLEMGVLNTQDSRHPPLMKRNRQENEFINILIAGTWHQSLSSSFRCMSK